MGYAEDMIEVIRLMPRVVSGKRLPDPTPFAVAGWTEVLCWDETSWKDAYWAFRFTAIVKPEGGHSPSLADAIHDVPKGPLEPFTISPETVEWFRRLAIRQGRSKRQARAIADLATKAERSFARSIATVLDDRSDRGQGGELGRTG